MTKVNKMSEEITERRITPEEIEYLIRKASDTELKYLLILELIGRSGGCGYTYLYDEEIDVIYGKAKFVTLERENSGCEWRKKILVIPFEVPTIVKVSYRDDNPEVTNTDTFYIFTAEGWKSIRVEVPK